MRRDKLLDKLNELGNLPQGWDYYRLEPPVSGEAVSTVKSIIADLTDEEISLLDVYPAHEGGLCLVFPSVELVLNNVGKLVGVVYDA